MHKLWGIYKIQVEIRRLAILAFAFQLHLHLPNTVGEIKTIPLRKE